MDLTAVKTNRSEFKGRMAALAAGLDGKVDNAVKAFAHELLDKLSLATPVDTMQARGNWHVKLDMPFFNFAELWDYKDRKGKNKPSVGWAQANLRLGHLTIDTYDNPDRILYLSNTAPYITYLNQGRSPQAPENFVESTILDARRILSDLRLIG